MKPPYHVRYTVSVQGDFWFQNNKPIGEYNNRKGDRTSSHCWCKTKNKLEKVLCQLEKFEDVKEVTVEKWYYKYDGREKRWVRYCKIIDYTRKDK